MKFQKRVTSLGILGCPNLKTFLVIKYTLRPKINTSIRFQNDWSESQRYREPGGNRIAQTLNANQRVLVSVSGWPLNRQHSFVNIVQTRLLGIHPQFQEHFFLIYNKNPRNVIKYFQPLFLLHSQVCLVFVRHFFEKNVLECKH